MNSSLRTGIVRSIRNSADYLSALAELVGIADTLDEIANSADAIEIEAERLRILVILLRQSAQTAPVPEPALPAPPEPGTAQLPWRTIQPCQQPRCCNCDHGLCNHRHDPNGEFRCNRCDGFVGYCGENGCDFGMAHDCRWSKAEQPTRDTEAI